MTLRINNQGQVTTANVSPKRYSTSDQGRTLLENPIKDVFPERIRKQQELIADFAPDETGAQLAFEREKGISGELQSTGVQAGAKMGPKRLLNKAFGGFG